MIGIFGANKEAIGEVIEDLFDKMAIDLLGNIPRLRNKKTLFISSQPNFGLANLFIQAMGNKDLNNIEKDVVRGTLDSSFNYIESLKNKTKSTVVESLDALIKEKSLINSKPTDAEINAVIEEEFNKAKNHMKTIAEAESTKVRNMGVLTDISRVASSIGDSDPNCFFVIVRDGNVCKNCMRLHMMPDKKTPRVWKLSELKQGFFKRGEDRPSVCGIHPFCRCALSYLSSGFGFDSAGYVTYIKENFDAFKEQRKIK